MFYMASDSIDYGWHISIPFSKLAISSFPSIIQPFFLPSLSLLFFYPLINIDSLYNVLSAEGIKMNIIGNFMTLLLKEDRHKSHCNKALRSYKR